MSLPQRMIPSSAAQISARHSNCSVGNRKSSWSRASSSRSITSDRRSRRRRNPPLQSRNQIESSRVSLAIKQKNLQGHLCRLGRLLIAYSGGVDSAYLAYAAHQALGENMLALIADSPSLARTQLKDALRFAE